MKSFVKGQRFSENLQTVPEPAHSLTKIHSLDTNLDMPLSSEADAEDLLEESWFRGWRLFATSL